MRTIAVGLLLAIAALCGCGDDGTPGPAKRTRPLIATTMFPITFVANALVADAADVVCPLPADVDPGTWKPTREALATFQDADLILYNGARFESWMTAVSMPRSRLVDTTADLNEPFITLTASVTHAHGGGKEHTHSQRDGHTWVDPMTLKQQAAAALLALRKLMPKHDFTSAAAKLDERLDQLDAGYRALGRLPERAVLTCNHPSYNYLARRYEWPTPVNLDLDPMKTKIDDQDLARVHDLVGGQREKGLILRFCLWESAPSAAVKETLHLLGLVSIVVHPADRAAGDATYLATVQSNIHALRPAFQKGN